MIDEGLLAFLVSGCRAPLQPSASATATATATATRLQRTLPQTLAPWPVHGGGGRLWPLPFW